MNIWLLQIGETLPVNDSVKLRTALLAEKLAEKGHRVVWWASAFDHLKKKWIFDKDTDFRLKEGITIKAIKGIGYKRNISLSRYFDHRLIARKFKRMAPLMPIPDIIISSMPSHDLAFEAVRFAKKNSIPILVDIRDQWPDIFIDHFSAVLRPCIKKLLSRDFFMVRETMRLADGLTSMMDTILTWGLNYAGRVRTSNDRVFYLGYKNITSSCTVSENMSSTIAQLKDKFVVLYIGSFDTYHDPSILAKCVKRFLGTNIFFAVAGDGRLRKKITKKTAGLSNIIFPGWLNQKDIGALLKHSHIGVCPTAQTAYFFPNKVFSYLSAGMPIISAFQGDLKEFIENRQIGFNYPPNDVNVLTSCIKTLYEDKILYKKMSENASHIFNEMFDAEKIYYEYVNHIERVAINRKNAY